MEKEKEKTNKKPNISVTLSTETIEKLKELTEKLNINRSAIITLAVNDFYEKNK